MFGFFFFFFFLLAKLIFTSLGQANKRVGSKEWVLPRLAGGRCGFIARLLKAKDSPFCPAQVRIALFTRLSHPHALSHWWQRDNCHEQELAVLVRQHSAFQTGPSPTDSSTPHSSTASKKRPIGCLGVRPRARPALWAATQQLFKTWNLFLLLQSSISAGTLCRHQVSKTFDTPVWIIDSDSGILKSNLRCFWIPYVSLCGEGI